MSTGKASGGSHPGSSASHPQSSAAGKAGTTAQSHKSSGSGAHKSSAHATHPKHAVPKPVRPIAFKAGVDESRVSEHSIAILNKIRLASGLRQLVITSTIRTPAEQAQEMYKLTKERSEILSRLAPDKVPLDQQERNLHAAQARVMRDQKMSADSGDRNEMLNQYSLDLQQSQREYEIYDKQRAQFQSVHAKDLKALAGTVTYKGVAGSVQDVAARSIARHEPEATTIKKMLVQIDKVNYVNVTTHAGRDGLEVVDLRLPANDAQRAKLLKAIKRELGNNVYRVGYPGGPATKKPFEFADPHCFHIEIFQPIQTGKPIEKVLDPRDTNPAQAQKVHGSA